MSNRKPFVVTRRSIGEVVANLPQPQPFTGPIDPVDLFIGARGFEERVLAIPRQLKKAGSRIEGKALLGRYQTNECDNAAREQELLPLLADLGATPNYFLADSPEDIRRGITEALEDEAGTPKHVLLDISGASSPLIFSAIGALQMAPCPVRLTVAYAAAEQYHEPVTVPRDSPVTAWAEGDLREMGVRDVDVNELFRGIHHDHLPGYAIVFPSMYAPRLQRCLSHLGVGAFSGAEASIYWVLPTTTDPEHQWRRNTTTQALVTMIHGQNVSGAANLPSLPANQHTLCDVSDYRSSVRIIVDQVDQQLGANLSLIHMGTKLQAVGGALALCGRPEVSLVGARPEAFSAQNYSKGIGHMVSIDLPDLHDVIRRITEVGMLSVDHRR